MKFKVKSIFLFSFTFKLEKDLHEALTEPDSFDFRDIIDCKIDVFKLLQFVQTLHLRYEVALQIQNLQMSAISIKAFNLLDVLLMQRDL